MYKKPYGDYLVIFCCVGDGRRTIERFGINPWKLIHSNPKFEKIMCILSEKELTIRELSYKLELNEEETLKLIEKLEKGKLVERRKDKFTTTIPILTMEAFMKIEKYLEPIAEQEAEAIEVNYNYIKEKVMNLPFSKDFNWKYLAHIIIDALILDFGVLHEIERLEEETGIRKLYSHWQKIIPFLGFENRFEIPHLGVNSNKFNSFGISILHSTLFTRKVSITEIAKKFENNVELLSLLLKQPLPLNSKEAEKYQYKIKELIKMNWLKVLKGKIQLNLPVIGKNDKKLLTKLVEEISIKIAEKVVNNIDLIIESYKKLNYSKHLEGMGDYLQLTYHILMGYTVKKLIEKEILPKLPKIAPPNYAVWMWEPPWTLEIT